MSIASYHKVSKPFAFPFLNQRKICLKSGRKLAMFSQEGLILPTNDAHSIVPHCSGPCFSS